MIKPTRVDPNLMQLNLSNPISLNNKKKLTLIIKKTYQMLTIQHQSGEEPTLIKDGLKHSPIDLCKYPICPTLVVRVRLTLVIMSKVTFLLLTH